MSRRHLVDPQLLAVLDAIPDFDCSPERIGELRENLKQAAIPRETYARPEVEIAEVLVPRGGGQPDVPCIVHRPNEVDGPLPVFLNLHGGGYIFGSALDTAPGDVRTAHEVGCLVVSVDYRLAPETPAPGALEDCYAVLAWLDREAERLGLDRTRFAIGGMSAGGGLAAALALLARDRGEIELCFQMLIYPMLDDRTARQPATAIAGLGEFVWTAEHNRQAWRAYLGTDPGCDGISPYAAPARAENLAGLPPAYIAVGMLDLFLDENLAYARRLVSDGVPAELHVLPGAYHGFEMAQDSDLARNSETERRAALARAFGRSCSV